MSRKKKAPKNEYELQCRYHEWEEEKFPYDISSGVPDMKHPATRQKATKKGYMVGMPDYESNDPRASETWESNKKCKLRIYPGKKIEFKNPNGKGRVSKDQKRVHHNLDRRGYFVIPDASDLRETQRLTLEYKTLIPLYKGDIIIDFEKRTITYPKKPKLVLPPRRGLNREQTKRIRKNRRMKQLKIKRKSPKPIIIKKKKRRGIRKTSKLKTRRTKKKAIIIEID